MILSSGISVLFKTIGMKNRVKEEKQDLQLTLEEIEANETFKNLSLEKSKN